MLYSPPHFAESLVPSFLSSEVITSDEHHVSELEVVAEAFRGAIADRELRHNREVAIGFIRNYAVTKMGLGNAETRIAYFEAQRRGRSTGLIVAKAMQLAVVEMELVE